MESKIYLLDTSAIFCLKDGELGADKVESILKDAQIGKNVVLASFMTFMEYLYISLIRYGEELARKAYLELALLPIKIIESNEEIRLVAAELKANYNLSLGDSWIAATAKTEGAILVHRDSEFNPISQTVKCLALPSKAM